MPVNITVYEINTVNFICHLFWWGGKLVLYGWWKWLNLTQQHMTQPLGKPNNTKLTRHVLHWLKGVCLTGLGIQVENHHSIILVGRHLCRSCSPAPCSKQYQLQRQIKLLSSSWVWGVSRGEDHIIFYLAWKFLFLKQICLSRLL